MIDIGITIEGIIVSAIFPKYREMTTTTRKRAMTSVSLTSSDGIADRLRAIVKYV